METKRSPLNIDEVMELPKKSSQGDLAQLRILYDRTESTVCSLRSVGVAMESYSTMLTPNIMSKIPPEFRRTISRSLEDELDMKGLLQSFQNELSLREKCEFAPIKGAEGSSVRQRYAAQRSGEAQSHSTSATLVIQNEKLNWRSNSGIPSCLFCGSQHYSSSCGIITNSDERQKCSARKSDALHVYALDMSAGNVPKNQNASSATENIMLLTAVRLRIQNIPLHQTPLETITYHKLRKAINQKIRAINQ